MKGKHPSREVSVVCALLLASLGVSQLVARHYREGRDDGSGQPLPFSHRRHAELGTKCPLCHTSVRTASEAGLPTSSICLLCHVTASLEESQHALLEQYSAKGGSIPWKRYYVLADHTFFSHRYHLEAGARCRDCHGKVEEKETLADDKPLTMAECVGCHLSTGAPIDCGFCHGTLLPKASNGKDSTP